MTALFYFLFSDSGVILEGCEGELYDYKYCQPANEKSRSTAEKIQGAKSPGTLRDGGTQDVL